MSAYIIAAKKQRSTDDLNTVLFMSDIKHSVHKFRLNDLQKLFFTFIYQQSRAFVWLVIAHSHISHGFFDVYMFKFQIITYRLLLYHITMNFTTINNKCTFTKKSPQSSGTLCYILSASLRYCSAFSSISSVIFSPPIILAISYFLCSWSRVLTVVTVLSPCIFSQ